MISPDLAKKYPKLIADGAKETSPRDSVYNCIAWSAKRDTTIWWQPGGLKGTYWPKGAPEDDYECFIALFERLGYKKCTGSHFEVFHKKVAIYASLGRYGKWEFNHVCDQLNSGAWTSKLGDDADIQHNSLEALEGDLGQEYGEVRQILKRRCWAWQILARSFFKIRRLF